MDPLRSRHRIIDASLNRAAEGLRVAEDVCRFHFGLPGLARELKELRHELLEAGRGVEAEAGQQLAARDIEGDVGRQSGVAGSTGRPAPERPDRVLPEAARSNLQRAREALRTLEEVTRHEEPARAGRFEAVRYRLYSVERALARLSEPRGTQLVDALSRASLCLLVTESLCRRPLEQVVDEALRAGVDMLQMREKRLSDAAALRRARWLREITARDGAIFIINDRVDLARLVDADGVHLGQDDLPMAEARSIIGEERLVGRSTHSLDQTRRAIREGADYLGLGPLFSTRTKAAGPPLGPEAFGRIAGEISIPFFAIGGVAERNIASVVAAGASRVAISAAILASEDVTASVRAIRRALDASRGEAAPPGSS